MIYNFWGILLNLSHTSKHFLEHSACLTLGISHDTECSSQWYPQWVALGTKLAWRRSRSLRWFLYYKVLHSINQLENLCSHEIVLYYVVEGCALVSCLHWCRCQYLTQLGSSQQRGSELADQRTRCAVSAGTWMPMLQWLLSSSNRWW